MLTELDFVSIRDARETLRQLVKGNPNQLREIDSMQLLDDLTRSEVMAKPIKERIAEYRERQKQKGIRGMHIYIPDTDRKTLEQLALHLNLTFSECVSYLLAEYQSKQEPQQ